MCSPNKHYLIYSKEADHKYTGHAVVYFVLASDPVQAIWQYLSNVRDDQTATSDGSSLIDGVFYPHPLAFVETWYKTYGEWQIREFPDWALQQPISTAFCGESGDGPGEIINICRKQLRKLFPHSRARAFVWYLRQGTLVTFYRKPRPGRMEIVQRYLWNWDGHIETVVSWNGDYDMLMADLDIDFRGLEQDQPLE